MRVISFIIRHLLTIGLFAGFGSILLSTFSVNNSSRVDGFGVEMSGMPEVTAENIDAQISLLKTAGVRYIRQEIDWSRIETSRDNYDWKLVEPLDLLFAAAKANEIKPVAVLTGGPVYLAEAGKLADAEKVGDRWEKFVQAAVDHFGENVDIWEIGKDLNGIKGMTPLLSPRSSDVKVAPDPVLYARLLRTAGRIIKNADPNDEVWMGSLVGVSAGNCAMNPLTYILEVHGAKGWRYADALLYRPRSGSAYPEFKSSGKVKEACSSTIMAPPASMSAEVTQVQDLARQLGGKKVIITGLGWSGDELEPLVSGRSITPAELESDLLVRASSILMAQNSISTIFWRIDLAGNLYSLNAMRNLQQTLKASKPLGVTLVDNDTVYQARFRKGGVITSVVWRVSGGDTPSTTFMESENINHFTSYPSGAVALTEAIATRIDTSSTGQAALMLSERPLILKGRSANFVHNTQLAAADQTELFQIKVKSWMTRWINNQKEAARDMVMAWFNDARESAVEWTQDQVSEILADTGL